MSDPKLAEEQAAEFLDSVPRGIISFGLAYPELRHLLGIFLERLTGEAKSERDLAWRRLTDQDEGWNARENNQRRDEKQSTDWLDGWEQYDAYERMEAAEAQLVDAQKENEELKAENDLLMQLQNAPRRVREIIKHVKEYRERAEKAEAAVERAREEIARLNLELEDTRGVSAIRFERAEKAEIELQRLKRMNATLREGEGIAIMRSAMAIRESGSMTLASRTVAAWETIGNRGCGIQLTPEQRESLENLINTALDDYLGEVVSCASCGLDAVRIHHDLPQLRRENS